MNGTESIARVDRHWMVLVLSMAGSAVLALVLGQDRGFDLLNYHYYSGFAFLHKPFGYDFAPAQIQSFHNPLIHVASYLALANLPAKAAAALFGAVQGLNFYLVFLISQILFSGFGNRYRYVLSLSNAAAGYYGISSVTELGTTYGDNLVSILVLSSLLLIIRRLSNGRLSGAKAAAVFGTAGFLVGAALGLKFTAAAYGLAVLLPIPLILLRERSVTRVAAALWCGFFIGFVAAYGSWGAKLYSWYGNPFFPYLNGIFRSPYFESSNFLDERFFPTTRIQTLFYPFFFVQKNRLVSEVDFRDIRLALCYTAIVLLAVTTLVRFAARPRKSSAPDPDRHHHFSPAFLAMFFAISYIGWLGLSSIYRYLCVLELIAPAFLALTLFRLVRRESFVFWASVALNIAILTAASPINFGRREFSNDLLKVQVPLIRDLDKSTILMSGYSPAAYIAPSFPVGTRLVRLSSTFSIPGRNPFLDREISRILALYDDRHTFAYVASGEEIGLARMDSSPYGKRIDARSCFEIRSGGENRGYLCGLEKNLAVAQEKPVPEVAYFPRFLEKAAVKVDIRSEGKYIQFRLAGLSAESLDILYALNGELMPPVRNWPADSSGSANLGPMSRTGVYRILGIRDAHGPDPDLWIRTDAELRMTN